MSNWQSHPEPGALVRLADGEVSLREARELEQHLEGCPACRAEVEELRATLADCLRYRSEVLQTLLPPPPAPWADLRAEFDRVNRPAEISGGRSWWRAPVLRWGLAAAAAVALTVGIFHQLRETPSVEAATLLRKAEAAAAARPVTRNARRPRLLIRTRTIRYTRLAGVAGTLPKEPAAPALEALFQEAHWDWNDPLSARAFEAWRDPLARKSDTITRGADSVEIRTTTPEGPLAAASLTLRAADLSPVEGRLEFRDQDWVEMSEIPASAPAPEGTARARQAVEPSVSPGEALAPASGVSEKALISSELRVLLKLHSLGADLGDPVEVSTAAGRVLVSGRAGLAPERQKQIEAAMNGIPHVTVQFSEATPPTATTEPQPAATALQPPAPASTIASRVERQLGGRPQFERFSSQMLDWTEAGMAQAYALRRLAEHFPPDREALLEAADRHALRATAREQAAALDLIAGKMARTLDPVLTGLGGQPATAASSSETWQAAAQDLLQTAQRTDRSLSVLLGATPGGGAAFSPSYLLADLARLEADVARCRRLLAPE